MPDDTLLITAYLADRHVPCPACRYDLPAPPTAGEVAACPECGGRWTMGLVRSGISRGHRFLLLAILAFLAVESTFAAARRWITVYDLFVVPRVVFVRATPGGPASSMSISANATPAQIQRAVAGGKPTSGWSSVPVSSWVWLGISSILPVAAWAALGLVMWHARITQRWLLVVTFAVVASMTLAALLEALAVAKEVMRRA